MTLTCASSWCHWLWCFSWTSFHSGRSFPPIPGAEKVFWILGKLMARTWRSHNKTEHFQKLVFQIHLWMNMVYTKLKGMRNKHKKYRSCFLCKKTWGHHAQHVVCIWLFSRLGQFEALLPIWCWHPSGGIGFQCFDTAPWTLKRGRRKRNDKDIDDRRNKMQNRNSNNNGK